MSWPDHRQSHHLTEFQVYLSREQRDLLSRLCALAAKRLSTSMSAREIANAAEIVPDRLYYAALRQCPRQTPHAHFFTVDNTLVYWNFFLDFGTCLHSYAFSSRAAWRGGGRCAAAARRRAA
jgi:hypothetical protein